MGVGNFLGCMRYPLAVKFFIKGSACGQRGQDHPSNSGRIIFCDAGGLYVFARLHIRGSCQWKECTEAILRHLAQSFQPMLSVNEVLLTNLVTPSDIVLCRWTQSNRWGVAREGSAARRCWKQAAQEGDVWLTGVA